MMVNKVAYREAKILHRDINVGNIMLNMDFEGTLNDWDHAISTVGKRKAHEYRTGTWQFMSINLLRRASNLHTIHDDVESAFWVLYYVALCFFKRVPVRSREPPDLDLFNECKVWTAENGQLVYSGGKLKSSALTRWAIQGIVYESAPLTAALHQFANVLHEYHLLANLLSDSQAHTPADWEAVGKKILAVDPIIKIFDDILTQKDLKWPEGNDAIEDQFPTQPELNTHRRLVVAHESSVTRSEKPTPRVEHQPEQADDGESSSMPPPASIPIRRMTRSVSRKKSANTPPPVAQETGVSQAISRSTSKRRIGDEGAKVEEEGSQGRTKRSRQRKANAIRRTTSEQTYNMRPRKPKRST